MATSRSRFDSPANRAQVSDKVMGLKALVMKIEEIRRYLEDVESGKLQINNKILFNLQVGVRARSLARTSSTCCQTSTSRT